MLCSRSASLIDQDADVPGHRDDHLPNGFCLAEAPYLTLSSLVTPSTSRRHVLTELAAQLGERVGGVPDGVV